MTEAPPEEQLIGQQDFCQTAGITYRQFDYWSRLGYITAEVPAIGQGSRRLFTQAEALRTRLMAELIRDAGITPAKAAELSKELSARGEVRCGKFLIKIEFLGDDPGA